MLILQIFEQTYSDPTIYGYIGAGSGIGATAGSIITMLVNKYLNKKKDAVDITAAISQQVKQVMENSEFQDNLIKQLREWSCYREACKIRLNGDEPPKAKKKAA